MIYSGDRSQIKVGSLLKVEITSLDSENKKTVFLRNGIVVFIDDSTILLSLDNEIQLSHNVIWLNKVYRDSAIKLGLSEEKTLKTGWWIDSDTKILEIIENEGPCIICQRKNFLTDKICWWCGNSPR